MFPLAAPSHRVVSLACLTQLLHTQLLHTQLWYTQLAYPTLVCPTCLARLFHSLVSPDSCMELGHTFPLFELLHVRALLLRYLQGDVMISANVI